MKPLTPETPAATGAEPAPHPAGPAADGRSPVWSVGGPDIDLADPHLYTTPRYLEMWREARRVHPVAWAESPRVGGFWSVTTYEEGRQVVTRPGVFTSTAGMRLGSHPAGVAAASGRMLVVSDGEDHRQLRAGHASWFNGKAVAALRPILERRLEERLTALLARDTPIEAVSELADPVPTWVLFHMLGVGGQDGEVLAEMTARAFDDADSSPAGEAARTEAHTEIFGYFAELLDERRQCPGEDIVSSLAGARVGGREFTDEEIILNCDGLMNGGLETTPHAITGALLVLARHPEAWQRLKADRELLDPAVEEVLRWTSPPTHTMRTAAEDTELGGARIRRGDRVVVWFPSCNRDESVFPEADTFLLDRHPNPHLSFGAGPHYCIGSALARIEVRCLLEVLLRRVQRVEVVGEPSRRPSNFLHGLERLRVRLVPEAGA
ncbi:hypothetical protein ACZ90_67985 [Streptomyces albus subsp. albus]|nr:hypothetical protein ACZ90_67985 [Streptomyces albus subsp. albus]